MLPIPSARYLGIKECQLFYDNKKKKRLDCNFYPVAIRPTKLLAAITATRAEPCEDDKPR
jgi:hypothetical protein